VTYVIAGPCIDVLDRACVEECPVDCIYEGGRALYIHPDECVDCGACEPVCPVEAICYEDDVPARWSAFIAGNAGSSQGRCPATRSRWTPRAARPSSAASARTPPGRRLSAPRLTRGASKMRVIAAGTGPVPPGALPGRAVR
jgi:NAD-dependent dihydropyrimidine dehydrogenase PreA subunit